MLFFNVAISIIMSSTDEASLAEKISSAAPYILICNHILLFVLLLLTLKFEKTNLKSLGMTFDTNATLIGIVVGISLFAVQHFITLPVLAHFELFTYWTGYPGTAYLISATLFAGVLEEAIFRGYGMTSFLKSQTHPVIAIFATTAAFAIFHYGQGIDGMLNAAVMGLVLGYVFYKLRNLPAVMIAHALANLLFIISVTYAV